MGLIQLNLVAIPDGGIKQPISSLTQGNACGSSGGDFLEQALPFGRAAHIISLALCNIGH